MRFQVGEEGRYSEVIADLDFETYSEAGYVFDYARNRWRVVDGTSSSGLAAVGMTVYAEHPTTRMLSAQYDLKDGHGPTLWIPGDPPPERLFAYIAAGGLLESWNDRFEFLFWNTVATKLYGWPPLPADQQRDAMAKARAFGLPGGLDAAGKAINADILKGDSTVMRKLSKPRNPTKKDNRLRHTPESAPDDFAKLYVYGIGDIKAEAAVSRLTPDLTPTELQNCLLDHRINARGVHIDRDALESCIALVNAAAVRYTEELRDITRGAVTTVSEVANMAAWISARGYPVGSVDKASVAQYLADGLLPPDCRRVLEIRQAIGGAAVKKLFTIKRQLASDGRLHDLYVYHGAHTGRAAGRGPQPTNLPGGGPDVATCETCKRAYWVQLPACPTCGTDAAFADKTDWTPHAVDCALEDIGDGWNLDRVEALWGSAFDVVSGCLRGLFCAAPGSELICSDYSSIEAVVLAAVAGEEWRLEVLRTHGRLYEVTAEMITGVPMTDEKHAHYKLGKVGELASGYQGWIGAWRAFGADKFLSDGEMKTGILKWRAASPMILELWGGQHREIAPWQFVPELYGLEGAAVSAVLSPGREYAYRDIRYRVKDDVLIGFMPTGRCIYYHQPRLTPSTDPRGNSILQLSYMGWNSDSSKGPVGWMRRELYGGRLTENAIQFIARDIQTAAMRRVDPWAPIVLHVYDEIASEVPEGSGDLMRYQAAMGHPIACARNWPIRASGGWIGQRFRKG